ncbi:MAG: PBP1A family penicillin-binding protein [Candidatus Levybacteria bacterium]|nr:PBP1A family penicillin-binding protein [Candidatus Levybacteria bacterium]
MRSRLDHKVSKPKKSKWSLKNFSLKEMLKNFIIRHKRKLFYATILLLAFLALVPPATYLYYARDLKDKDSVINRGLTGLTLQDRDGEEFYTFYQPKEITYIPFSDMPVSAQEAVISSEDKNFYTNNGFSITGIARAFVVNLFAGRIVEGGSTITQGLAKNAFLDQSRNYMRKYQEIVLAAELNRRFSKEDVLEMYLNTVYFGEGAFGIENAAQAYFGIPARDLTLSQSALLIGILPAPSAYSPLSNPPDKAEIRKQYVLGEMVEEGYITQAQADQAASEALVYNPNAARDTNTIAFHFANYIKGELIREYGEERVISEGFRVKTTLDREFQKFAEQTVKNRVANLEGNNASNASAVAIDPKNGQILAMVGSYDWTDEKFGQTNMAVVPRQPGSSFKPIIYAEALEEKIITPATILEDKETTFAGSYKPKNYDLRYRGDVTVRRALANSLNIPAVEIMDRVGVNDGINAARDLGITTLREEANYGLSLVLGTGEVPLLELTNAYAVFANEGLYNESTGVLEITNKYNQSVDEPQSFWALLNPLNWVRPENESTAREVMSREAAFLISSILSDNRARADVFGNALTISRVAAVKTGTTEDYRDALTVGYTPNLVVGVWVGNNDNTPMDNIAGSLGAAPIWRSLMENYLAGTPVEEFEKPTFVVNEAICVNGRRSGITEFFIAGTQPPSCDGPTQRPSPSARLTQPPTPTTNPDENNDDEDNTSKPTPQATSTPFPTPTTVSGATSAPVPTVQINVP